MKVKAPRTPVKLSVREELFCRYITGNDETFDNATRAYAEAYQYELDTLSREAVYSDPDEDGNKELIEQSEYDRAYNVCSVEGHRLLRRPKIKNRITELLNEMLKDKFVDAELARVIKQDRELPSKIAAIREYNKLRARISDSVTLKGDKDAPLVFSLTNLAQRAEQNEDARG